MDSLGLVVIWNMGSGMLPLPKLPGLEEDPFVLFLDTEFCESTRGSMLLSIGMVSGDREFYAELAPEVLTRVPRRRLTDFLQMEVLSQFGCVPTAAFSTKAMASDAVLWLNGLGTAKVEVAYDYSVDFTLLEQLLELAPEPLTTSLVPTHVGYLLEDPDGLQAASNCWDALAATRGIRRHHALADALALRARFVAVHGA